ncbi:MAG: septal ring lytic transglycosylase RlpA family protein [Potamolinea sp.]
MLDTKPRIPQAFNNGRMNKKFWSSITVTLLATILGTVTAAIAQQTKPAKQSSQASPITTPQVQPIPGKDNFASAQPTFQQPEVVKVGEFKSNPSTSVLGEAIARIYAYESGGRQAATLYVRSIPVLTFLGDYPATNNASKIGEVTTGRARTPQQSNLHTAFRDRASLLAAAANQPNADSKVNKVQNDPAWQAAVVAAKINQLSLSNLDASKISVSWKPECKCYSITANNQEIVQINQKTVLADTTRNLGKDALQATNRLRRLIGNAAPLRAIAGTPPAARKVTQVVAGPVRVRISSGLASWYGPGFHGNRSASGEIYNQNAMTAAHRSLPFGTYVQVTNMDNGRSVVVRINDRGPFIGGRVIDLSAAAARALGVTQTGVAPVRLDVLATQQVVRTQK